MTQYLGFTAPHLLTGAPENTPMLVAFSGGADSSVLLRLIKKYADAHGAQVYAAHVNHMIRGAEADRDEDFCRRACQSLDIPIFVLRRDIPAYARECGISVETAARQARYDFFDSLMKEHGIPLLATAHNANDNLETLIFNIARGSGLSGMCGIPPVRKCKHGTVVRPILGMSREDILDICEKNEIEYMTDSTNTNTDYTRNKIRASVVPVLTEINASAAQNAARLCDSLREDRFCLESMADMFCEAMNDDASFDIEKLLGSPAAIANRAVMSLYSSMTDGATLERVHIEDIRELCRKGVTHSRINLPRGIDAVIENNALHLKVHTTAPSVPDAYLYRLYEGTNVISNINAKIVIGNSQNRKNVYKTSIPMYLDFDKICGAVSARNRRSSDKIRLHGMSKSVKKLLCDMHIPLEIRYRLPMICVDDEIVAIPFVGTADGYSLPKEAEPSMLFTLL